MGKQIDVEKYKQMYLEHISQRHFAVLSMIDEEGKPFSSCSPFVKKDNKMYIYISQVAAHYHLLEKNDFVDVMLIADESETNNTFATERVRFSCHVENIGNEDHEDIFELFKQENNPNLIDKLRELDFSLFELTPQEGRYVVGFGLAFDLSIDGTIFNHVVVDKNNKGK